MRAPSRRVSIRRAVEPVVEERAVGEPGQRVVEGEVLGLRLARLQARSRRGAGGAPGARRSSATIRRAPAPSAGAMRVKQTPARAAPAARRNSRCAFPALSASGNAASSEAASSFQAKRAPSSRYCCISASRKLPSRKRTLTCRISVPGGLLDLAGIGDDRQRRSRSPGRASIRRGRWREACRGSLAASRGAAVAEHAAQLLDERSDSLPLRRIGEARGRARAVDHGVDRLVALVQDEGPVMAEIVVQPDAEIDVEPLEIEVSLACAGRRRPRSSRFAGRARSWRPAR